MLTVAMLHSFLHSKYDIWFQRKLFMPGHILFGREEEDKWGSLFSVFPQIRLNHVTPFPHKPTKQMVFWENHSQTKTDLYGWYEACLPTWNRKQRGGGRGGRGGGQSRGSLETQICTPSREFVPSLGTHFRSNDYLGDLIQVSFHLTLPCILSNWKIGWLLVFTNPGQKNIGPVFVLALSAFPGAGETLAPPLAWI